MEDFEDNRLFIGKIPSSISTATIEKYFGQFGAVAHVLAPRATGAFKIAFVTYADRQGLEKALEVRHELAGSELNVTKALPKSSRGPVPVYDTKKETRIFVGQIPGGTSEEELEGYFSKWGKVVKVLIPQQPLDKDKLYAFVTFNSSQEKFSALSARHQFKGAEIKVVEATPRPPRSRESREQGGSSGGAPYQSPYGPARGLSYQGMSVTPPSSQPPQEFEDNPTRIFVGRIPADTSAEELREYFGRFGNVVDVRLPSSRDKGARPEAKANYAFVTFSTTREFWKALASVPHTLRDQRIEVIEAKPKGVKGSAESPPSAEPRLFAGKIPAEVTDEQIRLHFSQYGKVENVHRPKQTAKDGFEFAFVLFSNAQDVARALSEDKHVILGKYELNVIRARPRTGQGAGGQSGAGGRSRSGSRDGSRSGYREAAQEYPRDDYGYARGGAPRSAPVAVPQQYGYPDGSYEAYRAASGAPASVFDNPYLPSQGGYPAAGYPAAAGNGAYPGVASAQGLYPQHYDPYAAQGYAPAPSQVSTTKHRYQPY